MENKKKKKLQKKVAKVNDYGETIEKIVERVIAQSIKPLQDLISEIELEQARCEAEGISIKKEKLEHWVLKLPLRMDYVGIILEQRSIDKDIAEAIKGENWDKAMLSANGKVDEQKAKANLATSVDNYVALVKKSIHGRIKSKLNYADKLFYGVKTVLGNKL